MLGWVFFAPGALALDIIPSDSHYYYALEGGSDISMPPVTTRRDLRVSGDLNTNLGYTCNGFNPSISMRNTLNDLVSGIEGMGRDILNSATAAVGSLPMYLLAKYQPALYSVLQNAMAGGENDFNISMKSCQDALNQINAGKSPYRDWFSVSDSQGWLNEAKRAQEGQEVDINRSVKQMTQSPEHYGLPWVHKGMNAGGVDQMPIRVLYDVVIAGYNVFVDPSRPLDSQAPIPSDHELYPYWRTPDAAGKWAQLVLGDITISAKDDDTHPGVGLTTLLKTCPLEASNAFTCEKNNRQRLEQLVQNDAYPTGMQLKAVSSNEMLLTPDLIFTLRSMTAENRAIAISKISEDVTIQNVMDEALLLRRLLIAGSQTKPVHNLKPALTMVNDSITLLDQDIKNLMFEHDVRKNMMANTVQTLMMLETANKAKALHEHDETAAPALEAGAVYKGGPSS